MNEPLAIARNIWWGARELIEPGTTDISGRALWRLGAVGLAGAIAVTNLIGAVVVLGLGMFVIPLPETGDEAHVRLVNAIAAGAYVAFAVPMGVLVGVRRLLKLRDWLLEDRPATAHEQRLVLRAPLRLFNLQVSFWLGAAVLFTLINLQYAGRLALWVAVIVALTGLTTASCAYLLTERVIRPAAARALAQGAPRHTRVPGVAVRSVLAWALGTAIPVAGLLALGIVSLVSDEANRDELALAMTVLAATALAVGGLVVTIAARATADPIRSVVKALGEVRRGRFDLQIPVYDGTEIGQLQLGFNQMAAGLDERERIRAAFGTYVDPEVAEHILSEGTDLAGEEVEVTIMFVDVRNFTGFAENTPAPDVVATINRLFSTIVPIVHEHGGRVDKFIGDGLLAVWGAPERLDDHAHRALAAALEIARSVGGGRLEVGIGLNSGTVVAGNVGGAGRLEFSVIGDAVNVAARVEAATRQTGDAILIAERTKELLRRDVELAARPGVTLKGKSGTVSLYAPA